MSCLYECTSLITFTVGCLLTLQFNVRHPDSDNTRTSENNYVWWDGGTGGTGGTDGTGGTGTNVVVALNVLRELLTYLVLFWSFRIT